MTFRPKQILVPIDFSPHSRAAADAAAELAKSFGGRLTLLHVIPLSSYMSMAGSIDGRSFDTRELRAAIADGVGTEARKELERLAGHGVAVDFSTLDGPAAVEVVAFAERMRAEMIVIGSHGRTGVKRMLMGSVAESVVRHASCPVLVVRGS